MAHKLVLVLLILTGKLIIYIKWLFTFYFNLDWTSLLMLVIKRHVEDRCSI